MRVILHIGTDKTGSTAIQSSLPVNREWFHARSVYLPLTGFGADNGHAALLEELDPDRLLALSRELHDAKAAGFSTALLSWEGMVRYSGRQIRALASALVDLDTCILVYVRDQAEIIQSAHLQWVRMHAGALTIRSIAQPSGLAERVIAGAFLRDPRRNYFRTLRRWERVMPLAKFIVRPFTPTALHNGDVVSDLLRQLGTQEDTAFLRPDGLTNPSLDVEGALLVQGWRRDPAYADKIDTLIDVTESVLAREGPRSKYFLGQSSVEVIRRHFRRSNRQLARRYMPGEVSPFPSSTPCWRTLDFAAIEAGATALSRRVWEVNCVPTLDGAAGASELPARVQFFQGWSTPEQWGIWSLNDHSCLRFRVHRRVLNRCDSELQVTLRGRYHDGIRSSDIRLNGRALGAFDLSGPAQPVRLPLTDLLPFAVVEICLTHAQADPHPGTVVSKDRRPLAFALSSISVEPARDSATRQAPAAP